MQELGGWSDIRMVQRYAYLAPEHLWTYAGKISGLRGVTGTLSTTPKKVLGARNKKTLQVTELQGFIYGAPGEIRTPDRSVRSRVLYPAELQVHI